MHAYIHGLELDFFGDDSYLFFPRISTDANDYPEKCVFRVFICTFFLLTCRILMTCLKYFAQCPCPRCLMLKTQIPRLGMEIDKNARQNLIRVDSRAIQRTVELARQRMFHDGINISSVVIDRLLKPKSLVPTRVSSFSCSEQNLLNILHRMPFHVDFSNTESTFIKCLCLTFCMNLNLVFGKPFSHISCVFCIPMGIIRSPSLILGQL